MSERTEIAFSEGFQGYLSDGWNAENPYKPENDYGLWRAWSEGFDEAVSEYVDIVKGNPLL